MNTEIATDNTRTEEVMGGHGTRTEKIIMVREGRLSSNHYELVIGGALFPLHKDHCKQTWISPGGSTKHQLDNAPFSKRWRSSL